ncbi:MAG: ATP-binding protein [Pseudomonadota bacterium]
MLLEKMLKDGLLSSTDISERFQFGFFEWNIKEDRIVLCAYLADLLAFNTHDLTQTYTAWRALTHSQDMKKIIRAYEEIQEKKTLYVSTESRKLCRDGTWRWVAVRGKIIEFDDEGYPIRAVGTCTDVTEIKEAELSLIQTKYLFAEIKRIKECNRADLTLNEMCAEILLSFEKLTCSSHALLLFNSSTNFNNRNNEFVNSNDPSLYNLDIEDSNLLMSDLEKLNFVNFVLNQKKNCIDHKNNRSLLGIHLDLPFHQQGVVVIERSEPFDDALLDFLEPFAGAATHIISIKKLQANTSELDNMLSFFIQQVPVPVAMFDTNMCYKFASDAWRKEFRFTEKSYNIIGRSHYETSPSQPKEWRERHQRALRGEIVKSVPEEVVDYFEQPIWLEGAIHPWYDVSGDIGGIIIYSNVVTEHKENEKNLKTTVENLIRSNQELERFAHVCSHDLKEPLRSISNFIHLLFSRNSARYDEESLLYVSHILKGIDRMNTLIKDVLLYSKISAQTNHDKILLDVNDIVGKIMETLDCSVREVDACFKIAPLPSVLGEPTQITQLFANLIENALKFHASKPLIIDLFAIEKTYFWEFHIRDNGIGIEKEYHRSIFSMFKRLHSKNQYEGSGIGLAICQKIVHAHLGKIYVKSVTEGGSEFIFTLPKGHV